MNKYNYAIYNGLLMFIYGTLLIVGLIVFFGKNILVFVIIPLSLVYSIMKLKLSIQLIIDKKNGVKYANTIFMGILSIERLEMFRKVLYYNIFFDDDKMTKKYMTFCNLSQMDIRKGDEISIVYYPLSRIVIDLTVNRACSTNQFSSVSRAKVELDF